MYPPLLRVADGVRDVSGRREVTGPSVGRVLAPAPDGPQYLSVHTATDRVSDLTPGGLVR